jgi:hypothetical protein
MKVRGKFCLSFFVVFFFATSTLVISESRALDVEVLEFQVIENGENSGYQNEAYIIIKTEDEWSDVWEKHTWLLLSAPTYPRIDFPSRMVICAFMGKQPTNGHGIRIERIFSDEEIIHVDIVKTNPPENLLVNDVVTSPFIFVSIQRTNKKIVFDITEETNTLYDNITPEFPTIGLTLAMLILFSIIMVVFTQKKTR